VQLDASPWVVTTDAALLAGLLEAVRGARTVAFRYTSVTGQGSVREVDVYRAVHLDGRWYAVGRCHLRGALRCFRLDRMAGLSVLDTAFTPPPEFDALAYLRATLPDLPASHEISVWLASPPEALAGRVSLWRTGVTPEGGGTRLKAQRERLESFAAFLLGLGCAFRVDGPPELRAVFGKLGERCVAAEAGRTEAGRTLPHDAVPSTV
jgi:predicted DNA-binding transcriptional regulator YafY